MLKGEDYRIHIVNLIQAGFLQTALEFLEQVARAKSNPEKYTTDWYQSALIHPELDKNYIATNSGINMKTIKNMYLTEKKDVVFNVSQKSYDAFVDATTDLQNDQPDLDITITIKRAGVCTDLTFSESLVVLNSLAVKRAALAGGYWSTAGKRVEKPLMRTLCHLYGVPESRYELASQRIANSDNIFDREIDFLLDGHKCEVKLMGMGNPESADVAQARATKVFIAAKLSEANKAQLTHDGVEWLELRSDNGYKRFGHVLSVLQIPYCKDGSYTDESLEAIFAKIF